MSISLIESCSSTTSSLVQKPCIDGRSTRPESSHSRLQSEIESSQSTQQSPQTKSGKEVTGPRNSQPKTEKRNTAKRDNKFKMRPHELYKQNQQLLKDMFTNRYYKKFFTVKACNESNLAELDVIKANKELNKTLRGKPKRVSELRDGSLLIEVSNEEQSREIKKLKTLDSIPVSVADHQHLNQIKGTIRYRNLPKYTDQNILKELEDQHVSDIYHITKKVNGINTSTNIYIVTFNACELPAEITIGWTRCIVKEYIPKPRRCFGCQRFGHGMRTCRSDKRICVRCNKEYHGDHCTEDPRCANCGEDHMASSTNCFYYNFEQETLAIQTREKMPYSEAKRKAKEKLIGVNKTYATVAAKSLNRKNTENNLEQNEERQKKIDLSQQKAQKTPKNQQLENLEPSQKHTNMTLSQHIQQNTIDISNKSINKKNQAQAKSTTLQPSNAITTIVSDRKHYSTAGAPERKRDHSELASDHVAERAAKKSMNNTSVASHLTHPSPSPIVTVPRDRESSRECKGPKENVSCKQQPTKSETNRKLSIALEDY